MKVKLFGIGGKNLTNKHLFPQANCLQILFESIRQLEAALHREWQQLSQQDI
jgi:hypothetical protein